MRGRCDSIVPSYRRMSIADEPVRLTIQLIIDDALNLTVPLELAELAGLCVTGDPGGPGGPRGPAGPRGPRGPRSP